MSVRFADADLWLTQNQLAEIYCTTQQNISLHIDNIYKDGELTPIATHKDFLLVRQEGNHQAQCNIAHCRFDTIFGTIFGTRKLFSKKIHSCGNSCNTDASACCMSHFTLHILQSSAQNPFRAEDFCSIIIDAHQNWKTEN